MKVKCATPDGFTIVEIMTVCAIIGLIVAIAVPHFTRARALTNQRICIDNLRQLEGAKVTWALELNKSQNDTPLDADLFGLASYVRVKPVCPGGGDDYMLTIGAVGAKPTCSLAAAFGHSLP